VSLAVAFTPKKSTRNAYLFLFIYKPKTITPTHNYNNNWSIQLSLPKHTGKKTMSWARQNNTNQQT